MEIQKVSVEVFCKRTIFFFFCRGILHRVIIDVFVLEKNKTNAISSVAAFYILTLGDLQVTSSWTKGLEVIFSWLMIRCFLETEICHTLSLLVGLAVWRYVFFGLYVFSYLPWRNSLNRCWPIIDHKGWSFLQILALVLFAGSKA